MLHSEYCTPGLTLLTLHTTGCWLLAVQGLSVARTCTLFLLPPTPLSVFAHVPLFATFCDSNKERKYILHFTMVIFHSIFLLFYTRANLSIYLTNFIISYSVLPGWGH